jgi:hypothetical protein
MKLCAGSLNSHPAAPFLIFLAHSIAAPRSLFPSRRADHVALVAEVLGLEDGRHGPRAGVSRLRPDRRQEGSLPRVCRAALHRMHRCS